MKKISVTNTRTILVDNLKDEKIIAVSDVHLGYRDKQNLEIACNKNDFNEFINGLGDQGCDRLIICGDFLDMWRRDPVGVTLENVDTLNRLKVLKESEGIKINFAVGNHDFYLRHFKEDKFAYDFTFDRNLILVDSEEKYEYWFLHGDRFDAIQKEILYDPFCLANDDTGQLAEMGWQMLKKSLSWWQRIKYFVQRFKRDLLEPLKPVEKRHTTNLLDLISKKPRNSPEILEMLELLFFPKTEKRAIQWAIQQEKLRMLTFGHTHQPFIHIEGEKCIANTGSWVNSADARKTNTYIVINNFQQSLRYFREKEDKPLLSTINRDDGVPTGLSFVDA